MISNKKTFETKLLLEFMCRKNKFNSLFLGSSKGVNLPKFLLGPLTGTDLCMRVCV